MFPHSSQNFEPSLFTNPQLEHFPGSLAGGTDTFPKRITSPTFPMLLQGTLPSLPSFFVINNTTVCVESTPTCLAIPIFFAFSSYTVNPSIELTDHAGAASVT